MLRARLRSASYRQIVLNCIALFATSLFGPGLFSGCASTTPTEQNHFYEFHDGNRFVRLEPRATAAQDNDHPFQIQAQGLQSRLSSLRASGIVTFRDDIEVFTEDEVSQLAQHLSNALNKAGPDQDVTFQSAGSRGIFGDNSPPSFSTGRAFVHNGRLNLIFGVLHSLSDTDRLSFEEELFPIGSRNARVEPGWNIEPGEDHMIENDRGDWISFALAPPVPTVLPATEQVQPVLAPLQPTPDASDNVIDQRLNEVESRLRVLDELKRKNLITEQEYSDKRRAILEDL